MGAAGAICANAMLYAVLRQSDDAQPFRIPMQGYYADTLSAEAAEAWRKPPVMAEYSAVGVEDRDGLEEHTGLFDVAIPQRQQLG
jgi:hypothetical protein